MIEIKSRWDGSVLYTAESGADVRAVAQAAVASGANLRDAYLRDAYLRRANLSRAYLSRADLSGAYLSRADLSGANLSRADLSRANLSGADLSRADLSGANLSGANLRGADLYDANLYGAVGITPERCTDLLILLEQVGKIRAYKLTKSDGAGPTYSGLIYAVDKTVEASEADTNPASQCGAGVSLATLPWCLSNWQPGYRIFVCEFTRADIAAIPTATDGKFRVHRCKVVREIEAEQIEAWMGRDA